VWQIVVASSGFFKNIFIFSQFFRKYIVDPKIAKVVLNRRGKWR
jgi:hypothetical protein